LHFLHPIAIHYEGRSGCGAPEARCNVPPPRSFHGNDMDFGTERSQMLGVLGSVFGPGEGAHRHLVPCSDELSQDIVSTDLGPGVQRIGNQMGKEEDSHPSPGTR
jgi:hypothetical protein